MKTSDVVFLIDWVLFEKNIGPYLSIDETALSQGELYTVVTNKEAKGKKGARC